jgi:hypothetical protein
MPPGSSGIGMQDLRGAASRVAVDATAFTHRATQYDFLILAQWADPAVPISHSMAREMGRATGRVTAWGADILLT